MVYAYFGPEGLYAYNATGTLAWKAVTPFATLGLGAGTSPVLYENLVIIQRDEDNGEHSAVVATDEDRQGGLEHEADRRDRVEHTSARDERRPDRARDERQ